VTFQIFSADLLRPLNYRPKLVLLPVRTAPLLTFDRELNTFLCGSTFSGYNVDLV